jgi:MFS family permease
MLMKDRILGLPSNVFFLGLTSLFNDFSSDMVASVFPAFFISVLKTGAESLGLMEGIADAASNLIKIFSGRWSDNIEKRKVFAVAGYTLSVFTRPLFIFAGGVATVVGLRLTDRIGKGLRDSPRDALISLSAPEEETGRSFGYHRAMDTLGAIAGPLVAYVVLSYNPAAFNSVFIIAFVVGLAAIASLWLVRDIRQTLTVRRSEARSGFPRKVSGYLVSIFILSIGTLPLAVLLLKTRDLGIAIASIPLFYAISNISYAVCSWPAGRAADEWGTGKIIAIGSGFLMLGYLVLVVSWSPAVLVIGFLLVGIFSAFTDGVQRSHLSRLVDDRYRGTAYGYLNAAVGFGALIAGVAGGFVWQQFGDTTALITGTSVIGVGLGVFSYDRIAMRERPSK